MLRAELRADRRGPQEAAAEGEEMKLCQWMAGPCKRKARDILYNKKSAEAGVAFGFTCREHSIIMCREFHLRSKEIRRKGGKK